MRRLVPGPAADAALPGAWMAPRPGVLAVEACALRAACGGCANPAARPSGRAAPAARSAVTRGDPRSQIQDAYAGSMAATAGYLAAGTGEIRSCRYRHAERCLEIAAGQLWQALACARAASPADPAATSRCQRPRT
jgi:hypothetical protein